MKLKFTVWIKKGRENLSHKFVDFFYCFTKLERKKTFIPLTLALLSKIPKLGVLMLRETIQRQG